MADELPLLPDVFLLWSSYDPDMALHRWRYRFPDGVELSILYGTGNDAHYWLLRKGHWRAAYIDNTDDEFDFSTVEALRAWLLQQAFQHGATMEDYRIIIDGPQEPYPSLRNPRRIIIR